MRAAMARRCAAWWRRSGLRRAASKRWGCIGARSRPCSTTADWRCNRLAGPMLADGAAGPVSGRMVDAALWEFKAILPRPTDNNDHLLLFHRMAAAHGTDGPRGSEGADEPDGPDGPPRGR